MRNIFDQYSKPENQLTHALVSTLHNDRKNLLRDFLRELIGVSRSPPIDALRIAEQTLPGKPISGDERTLAPQTGLPDACIFDDDGWVLLVESKVQAGFDGGQISRHKLTAKKLGFEDPLVLAIVVDHNDIPETDKVLSVEWRELYSWLRRKHKKSIWARHLTDYLEIFEARQIADDYEIRGTLTMFDGFYFDNDNPFNYREAKRLLRLFRDELTARPELECLGIDRAGSGRKKITGANGGAVWDYLPLSGGEHGHAFNRSPHFTFSVGPHGVGSSLTFPNALRGGLKTRFRKIGWDNLNAVLESVEKRVSPTLEAVPGSTASAGVVQRHYPSRNAPPVVDGKIAADLRTLVAANGDVKYQPDWIAAVYDLITSKQSNLQFQISIFFPYGTEVVKSRAIVDAVVSSWTAMAPMLDAAWGRND